MSAAVFCGLAACGGDNPPAPMDAGPHDAIAIGDAGIDSETGVDSDAGGDDHPRWLEVCPTERSEGASGPCDPVAPEASEPPCPEGWARAALPPADDAPTHCSPPPLPPRCDPGGMPVLGSASCQALGTDCTELPAEASVRARAPGYSGGISYVVPGAAAGDGSMDAPFGEVDSALAGAAAGDIIVLGAGDHVGPVDVTLDIAFVGACVAESHLTSSAPAATSGVLNFHAGGLVSTLRISGESIGLWVDGGRVVVRDIELDGPRRVGLRAAGSLVEVDAANVWIHDVRGTASDDSFGRGVQVSDGAIAHFDTLTIQRVHEVGALAIGAGSEFHARRLAVVDVLEEQDQGTLATGVEAFDGGRVTLDIALIDNTQAIGISSTAAWFDASNVLVRGLRGTDQELVRGAIRAGSQGSVTGEHIWLLDIRGPAIGVDGRRSTMTIDDLRVDDADTGVIAGESTNVHLTRAELRVGHGVEARNAAEVTLGDSSVVCSGAAPCVEAGLAGRVRLERARVRSTQGAALFLSEDGRAELADVSLDGPVLVEGGVLDGHRCAVDADAPLRVSGDADVALDQVWLSAAAGGAASALSCDGGATVIRGARIGGGVDATIAVRGGRLQLTDVRVEHSDAIGAELEGGVTTLMRVEFLGAGPDVNSSGGVLSGAPEPP